MSKLRTYSLYQTSGSVFLQKALLPMRFLFSVQIKNVSTHTYYFSLDHSSRHPSPLERMARASKIASPRIHGRPHVPCHQLSRLQNHEPGSSPTTARTQIFNVEMKGTFCKTATAENLTMALTCTAEVHDFASIASSSKIILQTSYKKQ